MKRLRFSIPNRQIGVFVTGEYGEKNKRPHWHAIIFGWRPQDLVYYRTNDCGDDIFTSVLLDKIWGKNDPEKRPNEVGSVSFQSAGYCARYAAKKLVHGNDGDHEFNPISKKSNKQAIGKAWLEAFWPDVFNYGALTLPDGNKCGIPRYYEKWLKKNQPEAWAEYIQTAKVKKIAAASAAEARDKQKRKSRVSKNDARRAIQKQKFEMLQKNLKL